MNSYTSNKEGIQCTSVRNLAASLILIIHFERPSCKIVTCVVLISRIHTAPDNLTEIPCSNKFFDSSFKSKFVDILK